MESWVPRCPTFPYWSLVYYWVLLETTVCTLVVCRQFRIPQVSLSVVDTVPRLETPTEVDVELETSVWTSLETSFHGILTVAETHTTLGPNLQPRRRVTTTLEATQLNKTTRKY